MITMDTRLQIIYIRWCFISMYHSRFIILSWIWDLRHYAYQGFCLFFLGCQRENMFWRPLPLWDGHVRWCIHLVSRWSVRYQLLCFYFQDITTSLAHELGVGTQTYKYTQCGMLIYWKALTRELRGKVCIATHTVMSAGDLSISLSTLHSMKGITGLCRRKWSSLLETPSNKLVSR